MSEFHVRRRSRDGLQARCKVCHRRQIVASGIEKLREQTQMNGWAKIPVLEERTRGEYLPEDQTRDWAPRPDVGSPPWRGWKGDI